MASVEEAARAFMERRGAPMTAENFNTARQFLTEQQPALLNSIMRDLDRGQNVTLAGRGSDLFDDGGGEDTTESQMDQFMRQSDGEDSPQQSQQVPTPPQQPTQRPQQARQSGAPQGTPPTPGTNPREQQAQTQDTGVAANVPMEQGGSVGGTGEQSVPGASGDSLIDEIVMSALGARAASSPTRAPRGAQVNTQMGRPGSAPQGPQTSASQPRIENVQDAQQVNDNLPAQRGQQPQQSQASQSLPGAGDRAQQLQGP